MQAVILAAGVGSRLHRVTDGLPKCLIPLGNNPLIEHQLEALSDAGIGKVLMVVGYKADEIRKTVGNRVEYVENPIFEKTNSLYSLWLARDWVKDPFILLNSDLFFHHEILHRLLSRGGNSLAYDSTSSKGQEQTKVTLREGKVIDIGKDLPAELAMGESLGLLSFDAKGSRALFSRAHALIQKGGENSWVIEAIRSTCSEIPLRAVNVAGLPWVELDFPYDLERARKEVWPAIFKSRWQKTLFWRRTRWVAMILIFIVLVYSGWWFSSFFQPEKIDWTNLPLQETKKVTLVHKNGHQNWWMSTKGEPLGTIVEGPAVLRVEVRLALLLDSIEHRYVIQVLVDGKPKKWEAFKTKLDPAAAISDQRVSERDRAEIEIPKGNHLVEVDLLVGTSEMFLARIRLPEPSFEEDDEEIQE